jgi:3-phenylpropionate/trans-cinnamate dioxygenase ferredoxin subunit
MQRTKHVVAALSEFPPGTRRIVTINGRSIGVFNLDGRLYALRSLCPHQGAPLCLGRIVGTNVATAPYEYVYAREGEIIKCPWHGWEFDIATGQSVFNPHRVRIQTYDVTVEDPADVDPSIETFPVTVESEVVVVHV